MKIKLQNLNKSFSDSRTVLKDICFEDEVTSLAVIGPSGGGKSTLLRILGGLITPDSGRIEIDGEEILFDNRHLIDYRREIGFVFQQGGLFHHMTARENIVTPLVAVHGCSRGSVSDRTAISCLRHFPAVSDSASRSPAPLHRTRSCCFWTSRQVHLTRNTRRKCSIRSAN